jgi:hypothetical protein
MSILWSHKKLLLSFISICQMWRRSPTAPCTKLHKFPAICALCNDNNPANYKRCTIYKELQQWCRHSIHNKFSNKNQQPSQLANTQPNSQPTNFSYTNTRNRSYANAIGNNTTQNKNADFPSSNLENVISKFVDDF